MRPLYLGPGEAIVVRRALMTYRNKIAEGGLSRIYPSPDDGFELLAADAVVQRLDAMSQRILVDNDRGAVAPAPRVVTGATMAELRAKSNALIEELRKEKGGS